MRKFREHKAAVLLIVATLVIAVLIGIFGAVASRETASIAENAVGAAAEPGQAATSGIGGWFRNIFTYFGSVKALRTENEALKKANVELDKQVRDMMGLEAENDSLRMMLDLAKIESKLDLVATQVIAKNPSNWYSSFTINKGTDDGIEKNQPVFTANCELIGQVYKVGSSWAEVITILDPDSGVGSMISRTKDIGVLEGDSSLRLRGLCRLGYLSRDAEIAVGDYVETSGMGGIYPKGLLVGKVTEISEDNATMSKYATVEPIADIGKVTEVFVLKSYTEELKPITVLDEEEQEEDKNEDTEEDGKEETPSATTKPTSKPTAQSTATTKPTTKPTSTPKPTASATSGNSTSSQMMNGSELTE
ncbi:MAG: rod shape-determining protein MreC [Clostridia bacterium]|nr:rod shape-determining protein MreC [Clostridia bacterium]